MEVKSLVKEFVSKVGTKPTGNIREENGATIFPVTNGEISVAENKGSLCLKYKVAEGNNAETYKNFYSNIKIGSNLGGLKVSNISNSILNVKDVVFTCILSTADNTLSDAKLYSALNEIVMFFSKTLMKAQKMYTDVPLLVIEDKVDYAKLYLKVGNEDVSLAKVSYSGKIKLYSDEDPAYAPNSAFTDKIDNETNTIGWENFFDRLYSVLVSSLIANNLSVKKLTAVVDYDNMLYNDTFCVEPINSKEVNLYI